MANKYTNVSARDLSKEELLAGIKSMSKTANQRLLSLERAGINESSPAYQYVKDSIEKGTMKGYAHVNAKGQVRFGTVKEPKEGDYKKLLKVEYEKLQNFLETKTSQVGKAKKFIEESQKQIAKISDSELKPADIGSLWSEPLIEKYFKMYGYTEFNRITNAVENLKLTKSDITNALKYAGFNEESTDDNKPALKDIEKTFKNWKELKEKESEQDNPTLTLPEEL